MMRWIVLGFAIWLFVGVFFSIYVKFEERKDCDDEDYLQYL